MLSKLSELGAKMDTQVKFTLTTASKHLKVTISRITQIIDSFKMVGEVSVKIIQWDYVPSLCPPIYFLFSYHIFVYMSSMASRVFSSIQLP